jgi:hypothetical protein
VKKGKKLITIFADFIDRNKTGIIATLFFHVFAFSVMVFIDISRTFSNRQPLEIVEIRQLAEDELKQLELLEQISANQEANGENIKNVAVDQNASIKSFGDYENDWNKMIGNPKNQQLYQAQDYADKRWLIKDYEPDNKTITSLDGKEIISEDNKIHYKPDQGKVYFGPSTLAYKLQGRTPVYLPIPSYKCIGSGVVVADISVNKRGEVTSITIVSTTATEECLTEAARNAANNSQFNTDWNAPAVQKGTITYTFIAQ